MGEHCPANPCQAPPQYRSALVAGPCPTLHSPLLCPVPNPAMYYPALYCPVVPLPLPLPALYCPPPFTQLFSLCCAVECALTFNGCQTHTSARAHEIDEANSNSCYVPLSVVRRVGPARPMPALRRVCCCRPARRRPPACASKSAWLGGLALRTLET